MWNHCNTLARRLSLKLKKFFHFAKIQTLCCQIALNLARMISRKIKLCRKFLYKLWQVLQVGNTYFLKKNICLSCWPWEFNLSVWFHRNLLIFVHTLLTRIFFFSFLEILEWNYVRLDFMLCNNITWFCSTFSKEKN